MRSDTRRKLLHLRPAARYAFPAESAELVLRRRLESLVTVTYGRSALVRPACGAENERYCCTLQVRGAERFTWMIYDDEVRPQAIGIRAIGDPFHAILYEVVECKAANDIRRTHWQFRTQSGWKQLTVA